MSKTGAERQAAYRARRSMSSGNERRITAWISSDTYAALEQLTARYGVTKRALLEILLRGELEKEAKPKNKKKFSTDNSEHGDQLLLRNLAPPTPRRVERRAEEIKPVSLRRNEEAEIASPSILASPALDTATELDGQYQLDL